MNSIFNLPQLGPLPDFSFPPPEEALEYPNGLLAWGGDLHPERLLAAYRKGIFPWYSDDQPILWWSPAPRCVLFPENVYLSRRTKRRYNSGLYQLTCDAAFPDVIEACAEPRDDDDGTWITREMVTAYCRLHEQGHAHSVEAWQDGELAGGIYGLAIGSMFFGESMFSRRTDASKLALVGLCRILCDWGYGLLDCQVGNPHLFRMGAEELSRKGFGILLRQNLASEPSENAWLAPVHFEQRW